MSRSYKKVPHCKCEDSCKWGKRQANKKVRRYKGEITNGKGYKKLYESWNICDYHWIETWEQYKEWCERPRWWSDPREAVYYEWYKFYKQK